jgi:hypothetical protein
MFPPSLRALRSTGPEPARHRADGKMTFVNIPVPAVDPADEWFD